ncbi:hypothetical protein BH23BAC3_BH23BAC3_07600 [soil metagenome]
MEEGSVCAGDERLGHGIWWGGKQGITPARIVCEANAVSDGRICTNDASGSPHKKARSVTPKGPHVSYPQLLLKHPSAYSAFATQFASSELIKKIGIRYVLSIGYQMIQDMSARERSEFLTASVTCMESHESFIQSEVLM